jgi:hypothetical protein
LRLKNLIRKDSRFPSEDGLLKECQAAYLVRHGHPLFGDLLEQTVHPQR